MGKQEFLRELEHKLSGLKTEDLKERLAFYSEMIDGRMEDGETELQAVAEIGSVDDVVAQIISEIPLSRLVRERVRPVGSINPGVIVLLVLGFPVWFPLLIAAGAVLFSLFIALWAIVLSFYITDLALAIAAILSTLAVIPAFLITNPVMALILAGAGLTCFGLTILMFLLSSAVAKGAAKLTKWTLLGIKSLFVGKEEPWNA